MAKLGLYLLILMTHGKSGEVLWSTKRFWSFTLSQESPTKLK